MQGHQTIISKCNEWLTKDEPWKGDNVSIDFIVPDSEQDKKKLRARVEQNASGTIQPFDVTTYQYDSTLIDPTDITTIFKAIIVFLNGGGYTDPFIGTPKQAKTLPRHSNIKPHRGSTSSTPLTCSRNISIDENYLNEMTIYCLGDIIPLNENKQYNKNRNMKQTIKLRESELKRVIAESVNKILSEAYGTPSKYTKHQYNVLNGVENHYDAEKGGGKIFPQNKRVEFPTDSERYSVSNIFSAIKILNDNLIDTEERWSSAMSSSTYTLTDKMARKYGYKILDNLKSAEKLSRRMMVLLKMQLGEQPDSNYFDKYKPSQDDGGFFTDGGGEGMTELDRPFW